MTRNLVSVVPDQTVQEALILMTSKKCRHLPVFKDSKLHGILSIGDLVKWIIRDQQFEIGVLEDYISGR